MTAYSSARSIMGADEGMIFLDANESPYEPVPGVLGYSRYPSQQPEGLLRPLADLYGVAQKNVLVCRGADEGIDILIRTFCDPGKENIITCPPTFAVYAITARINKTDCKEVPLTKTFQLDVQAIKNAADERTKIIFVCSPNNPTGNLMRYDDIMEIVTAFSNEVVVAVDETYIEFADRESLVSRIENYPNIIVLRTTSKAYATAGVRCGAVIAHSEIIALMRKVLQVYPIPVPVLKAMQNILKRDNIRKLQSLQKDIVARRNGFEASLEGLDCTDHIYPSDANFLLVRFKDGQSVKEKLLKHKIVTRDMSGQPGLKNCHRIAIGSAEEMDALQKVLSGNVLSDNNKTVQRRAEIVRNTIETNITVKVNLDKDGHVSIDTGIKFFDHMLEQIAKHAGFSLSLQCAGDLDIDTHHSIEDCAIALGMALDKALGDRKGVARYGAYVPMDEALASVILDLSGRPFLSFTGKFPDRYAGEMPADMVEHFFRSLVDQMNATLHIEVKGENTHHMVEACFKGFARAMRQAVSVESDRIPSTKGML